MPKIVQPMTITYITACPSLDVCAQRTPIARRAM
jgi:hypothetical protein